MSLKVKKENLLLESTPLKFTIEELMNRYNLDIKKKKNIYSTYASLPPLHSKRCSSTVGGRMITQG